jgi:hypothetical protein
MENAMFNESLANGHHGIRKTETKWEDEFRDSTREPRKEGSASARKMPRPSDRWDGRRGRLHGGPVGAGFAMFYAIFVLGGCPRSGKK